MMFPEAHDECQGTRADLRFLSEEDWLQETVVQYLIDCRKGRFWISMIFIDARAPLRFLIREINHYPSLTKAEQAAQYFQRGIRRDPRGTLKISIDAFNICFN